MKGESMACNLRTVVLYRFNEYPMFNSPRITVGDCLCWLDAETLMV